MNKAIKITSLAFVIIMMFLGMYYFAWSFAPGSYPRAEVYVLDVPEDVLIQIIRKVKKENIELCPPYEMNHSLQGGRDFNNKRDFWYDIYFYYPDKNQIVKTWTRPKTEATTSFAFVGINQGLTLGNWKSVNESFLWWENRPIKKEFEEKILIKIQEKISSQRSSNYFINKLKSFKN